MTDNNETLKKLLAIVQKQQKVIEKMAQMQLQPQKVEPIAPSMHPEEVIKQHLPSVVNNAIYSLKPQGNVLWVSFKQGMASQAAFDTLLKTVQNLVNKNLLPFAYQVKAVEV